MAQEPPRFVDQNWSEKTRKTFWFIDQGSRLIPVDWFKALELPDSSGYFAEHLERFGFIADTFGASPDALPIGFASGEHSDLGLGIKPDGKWIGLTCAACHTGNLRYHDPAGRRPNVDYLIEGAPSLVDFDGFLAQLVTALEATAADTEKWSRFQAKTNARRSDFDALRSRLALRRHINTPDVPAGFGRVDAFGHIFNQVAVAMLGDDPSDAAPPDAPVSYPCLWDIAQHKRVQWNASAANVGTGYHADGAALRNTGEVLGVFGEIKVASKQTKFPSSAKVDNLRSIEAMIADLRSPAWPILFPPIDEELARKGQEVYQRHCSGCHAVIADPMHPPKHTPTNPVSLEEVQTDPAMAEQYESRRASSGALGTRRRLSMTHRLLFPNKTAKRDYLRTLTGKVTVAALLYQYPSTFGFWAKNIIPLLVTAASSLDVYKARPLNGIWATAPYLHNGSVPNLWELLQTPQDRLKYFCVGDGEYDPKNGGYLTYVTDRHKPPVCTGRSFLFDTTRRGNLNTGHTFGVELPSHQKWQLIEYLKTL